MKGSGSRGNLIDVIKRKIFLSRYFINLENFSKQCKERYEDNPKKAIRQIIWWNFKQSFKIFSKSHANDDFEPYIDKNYNTGTKLKVLFPYEQIEKNSNVVIYGEERYSRQIIKQNNITKYCKVIGVVDDSGEEEYEEIESVPVIPNIPMDKCFDYLIMAYIDTKKQQKVLDKLDEISFPMSKTIVCLKEVRIQEKEVEDSKVRICAIITGGLGDYIIEKRALIAIQQIDSNAIFYITTNELKKKGFLDAVYFDMKDSFLLYENENEICYSEYDLVLRIEHIIQIIYADLVSLRKKSEGYYNFVKKWQEEYDHIKEFNTIIQYESVIHVNRAKILKLNRYSTMASYTSLDINDHRVPIAFNTEYKKEFTSLGLPDKYITVNYGADTRSDGLMQVKTWPIDNYNSLIRIIRENCPYIKIVQLGNDNSPKMSDIDEYVFGKHLEIVKYVLKGSQLHIDCEGGLVHLATQLGTCCAVLFGPTPAFYYGYDENINILPRFCGECMGTTERWYTHCILNDEYPARCMKSITPEYVFECIKSKVIG